MIWTYAYTYNKWGSTYCLAPLWRVWRYKRYLESVYRRRTKNRKAKRKRTKGQTTHHKTNDRVTRTGGELRCSVITMTWLTFKEYLCNKWTRICSTCRKHFPGLSSFMCDWKLKNGERCFMDLSLYTVPLSFVVRVHVMSISLPLKVNLFHDLSPGL
jgi:hypothetical protein